MPELPEVERAACLLRSLGAGKVIERVETQEDTIVYTGGISHLDFAKELKGRTVQDVLRYGKVFYFVLAGEGRMPVLHFGMTGMLQVRGDAAKPYRSEGRKKIQTDEWPPRFMKFILHFRDPSSSDPATEVAFVDPRRLGRIRLCTSPKEEPPISLLGFDPIHCMPTLDAFSVLVKKRSCPIKALLLDQSFSAGVGNWVADEVLYHARVHPEQRCNSLSDDQVRELHHHTRNVCVVAVDVNADDEKFPENWLFKHRWGKGKKEKHTLKLPDGKPATIKWITVGGRTSAYVVELQKLPGRSIANKQPVADEDDSAESDLTPLEDSGDEKDTLIKARAGSKRKRKVEVIKETQATRTSTRASKTESKYFSDPKVTTKRVQRSKR